MSDTAPRRAVAVFLALVALASCGKAGFDTEGVLDRWQFRCLAASESMRTIAPARLERKTLQLARIDRLLGHKLEVLDDAKLRTERAVLVQELEDANFLYECAETYYAPGSTGLRPNFGPPPDPYDAAKVRNAFDDAIAATKERHRPHGFDERTALHTAEAHLRAGEYTEAVELARAQLAAKPSGLYADTLELVIADAELGRGNIEGALELYNAVGKLPIGVEAHYARYRKSEVLKRRGDGEGAEAALGSVKRWADRGDREPLARRLRGEAPIPPVP